MLIAFSNVNPACNDTSFGTVTILPEFILSTSFLSEPCTQNVAFTSSTYLDTTSNVIYQWNFGDPNLTSDTSGLQNPLYTFQDTGTFSVTIIAYSPTNPGCNDTGTFLVTIFPAFSLDGNFTGLPCSPDVNFFGSSSYDPLYPVNYFWDFGVQPIFTDTSNNANPNYTYPGPGTYNTTLIAYTDSPACGDTTQLTIVIYPEFKFTPSIFERRCSFDVEFKASSTLDNIVATNYSWNFGDGQSTPEQNTLHSYTGAGTYNVTLTVNTANGCSETYSQLLVKSELAEIFVPNAFTPNGDGENDVLYVRGDIDELTLSIYDRWGEKVFETNEQALGWDGTHNGKLVDPGVFVYHLTTKCISNSTLQEDVIIDEVFQKGNITVIR